MVRLLGVEYLGRTELANEPVSRERLRGAQNGAFNAFEALKVDQWDFKSTVNHPVLGGFENGKQEVKNEHKGLQLTQNQGNRGKPCRVCGRMMLQTFANCYRCGSCGEPDGLGCGA